MKRKIAILAIYLSGVVVAYTNGKRLHLRTPGRVWTKMDRVRVFPLVIFSWVGVVVEEAVEVMDYLTMEGDSPASW